MARATRLDRSLDAIDLTEELDELDPTTTPDPDLSWADDDPAHAGTMAAAATGDLTTDEAVDELAAGLGLRERSLDEDDYDR